ncbi:minor capsid protein [Alkalibacillus almallahensis]|uniref:minor capsid protein n=1 Tax=Alkalibacillus almallahensis TaxID=1379154 RepID=UPI00141FD14A|nr:minor capsid protein [Alkalibacillus almallahensis]NIK12871.1 hypothetical protein [Alkalibacillus almallahensis]
MFKVSIDLKNTKEKLPKSLGKAQVVLDNQVLKDSNNYVPMDTKNLRDSGIRETDLGTGQVNWETPYAKKLYYNPQYDFSKDDNPNAQGLWYEAAKANHKKDWIDVAQKAFRSLF